MKCFVANTTSKWFLPSVNSQVYFQIWSSRECFCADLAFERFFSSMSPAMPLKSTCTFEGFAADRALEAQSFPPCSQQDGAESLTVWRSRARCGQSAWPACGQRVHLVLVNYIKKKLKLLNKRCCNGHCRWLIFFGVLADALKIREALRALQYVLSQLSNLTPLAHFTAHYITLHYFIRPYIWSVLD